MAIKFLWAAVICVMIAFRQQFSGQGVHKQAGKQNLLAEQDIREALRPDAPDAAAVSDLEIAALPRTPLIEIGHGRQNLNFDLFVTNHGSESYKLAAIRLRVYDRLGKLEIERELNGNGHPPAIESVGDRDLPAHSVVQLFQPFYDFDSEVNLNRIHLELLYMRAGHTAPVVPLTADEIVSLDVMSAHYSPLKLCLPLQGLVLVHDGHDFYSHHRRFNFVTRFQAAPAKAVSANLYAYDFVLVSPQGNLFRGDSLRKENWLSYGAKIFSPGEGTVLEAVTNVPENSFLNAGEARVPAEAEAIDPNGLGNHVKILHADGRVSWLLHMQPGSLTVKTGERIPAGQLIGRVGFSGDSLFPHLHYTVTDGSTYPSQGVPSYFRGYVRILGSRRIRSSSGHIDTGDLVKSDGQVCHSSSLQ